MQRILIISVAFFLFTTDVIAQTVSIISQYDSPPSLLVEASLKRNLRAEGYTVKSGTNDGILIVLSVMELKNRSGLKSGVVGHVSVVAVGWQNVADLVVSGICKEQHSLAQQVNDYLGTRLIYLNETMAVSSDEEVLGEMLATSSNQVIRPAFKKMQDFLVGVRNQAHEPSSDVINPIR